MADVNMNSVRKVYPNGFEAIHGIDLHIADGEFLVLVGPSGCGKSTLLRMVAGLETITDGDMHIGERRVNDLEPAQRNIAMVFQNYALYPHMSVFENMAYGLRNKRTPKDEIEKRVAEAARILELEGLLERRPRQLSGGQRQRVAMGRAIVREPSVFLFDEPLSNLDAKLRVQMRIEVRRLQRSLGTTSIYVTHDQVEAMTMADRIVVMNEGRAEQVGTPLEVYARPASTFVAGFIGAPAMNLVPAHVESGGIRVEGVSSVVPWPAATERPAGPITLGIRPEDLSLENTGTAFGTLTVELVEPLGAESLIHGQLDGGPEMTIRLGGTREQPPGTEIPLFTDPEKLHLFDEKTGRSLLNDS